MYNTVILWVYVCKYYSIKYMYNTFILWIIYICLRHIPTWHRNQQTLLSSQWASLASPSPWPSLENILLDMLSMSMSMHTLW